MRDLGTVKGDPCSSAYAMNAEGQVIGASLACDFSVVRGFLWEDGRMIDLDRFVPPNSGISLTDPSSINDRGEIVIGGTLNGNQHAFVLVPCGEDHADEEGCNDASEDATAAIRDIRSLPLNQNLANANGLGLTRTEIAARMQRRLGRNRAIGVQLRK